MNVHQLALLSVFALQLLASSLAFASNTSSTIVIDQMIREYKIKCVDRTFAKKIRELLNQPHEKTKARECDVQLLREQIYEAIDHIHFNGLSEDAKFRTEISVTGVKLTGQSEDATLTKINTFLNNDTTGSENTKPMQAVKGYEILDNKKGAR